MNGEVIAYLDSSPVEINGTKYSRTIRSSNCDIIAAGKCCACRTYRTNLRSIYQRWKKRNATPEIDLQSHCNERYLNTPQKKMKISKLRSRTHNLQKEISVLQKKIDELINMHGQQLDQDLHSDLHSIMVDNDKDVMKTFPEGSFQRLFWTEQLKASSVKDARQVRWHPVLIKWCLNLKLLSSGAYEALRTSGFIKLPSDRTLRDYSNVFTAKAGFQDELDKQLVDEIESKALPSYRKFVGIVIDEMKVKEGIVYNKYNGEVIGFTNIGDVNNDLLRLEQEGSRPFVAKYLLVLMVRGTLFNLTFPYAHFTSEGITADLLFPIIWEAVRRLECNEIKVISVTADGASSNRKFFRLHSIPGDSSTQGTESVHVEW